MTKNSSLFRLRPHNMTLDDCVSSSALFDSSYPELPPRNPRHQLHRMNTSLKNSQLHHWLLECDQDIVGEAYWFVPPWTPNTEHVWTQLNIQPAFRNRGAGTLLLQKICAEIRGAGYKKLRTVVRDDDPISIAYATGHSLTAEMSFTLSSLRTIDPLREEELSKVQATRAGGIECINGEELREKYRDWEHCLWSVFVESQSSLPTPEPHQTITFDRFKEVQLSSPNFNLSAWSLATDGERLVGLTGFSVYSKFPNSLEIDFTGVVPSHRRRGIARLLKVAALENARARGAQHIYTENASNNPMLSLNFDLGFKTMLTKHFYAGPVPL